MMSSHITPLNKSQEQALKHKIDQKTKPLGALGKLEKLALQVGCIQNTLEPKLQKPTIVVFAGDHGIVKDGVSPYPQEVTYQMVFNFLQGGAAINVFARQHGLDLMVVDAGVNFDFETHQDLVHAKVDYGTKSYLHEPAMTEAQCLQAINKGASIIEAIHRKGCNTVGFGEMGIGNTSSASVIMSLLCGIPLEDCVGKGTGLDGEGLKKKKAILASAIRQQEPFEKTPLTILKIFGGFEIAMMCGAILKAAELGMSILVDGFIASSAVLVASKIQAHCLDYCIFSHQSDEYGHQLMLKHLNADPILKLDMRLGEGTGAAMAFPILQSAVYFLNQMASFESAGVSKQSEHESH